jgi:hypothetical protein
MRRESFFFITEPCATFEFVTYRTGLVVAGRTA